VSRILKTSSSRAKYWSHRCRRFRLAGLFRHRRGDIGALAVDPGNDQAFAAGGPSNVFFYNAFWLTLVGALAVLVFVERAFQYGDWFDVPRR